MSHSPPVAQVACRRAVPGDVPCRRNVVCGDRVSKVQQHVGVIDGFGWLQLHGLNKDNMTQDTVQSWPKNNNVIIYNNMGTILSEQ